MKIKKIIDFETSNILIELKTNFDLRKFKQIEGIKNKIVYANTHLNKNTKYLGHGSSRIAFLLSNKHILKIVRPNAKEKGIAQNKAEVKIFNKTKSDPIITKIYDFDPNYNWIISELVRPLNNIKDFENLSKIKWHDYINIIKIYKVLEETNIERAIKHFKSNIVLFGKLISSGRIKNKKEEYEQKIEDYKRYLFILENNNFIKSVIKIIEKYNLLAHDLTSLNHWGKTTDGRIVLLDYGYTEDVWEKHYRDD